MCDFRCVTVQSVTIGKSGEWSCIYFSIPAGFRFFTTCTRPADGGAGGIQTYVEKQVYAGFSYPVARILLAESIASDSGTLPRMLIGGARSAQHGRDGTA